jgi:hypothetical protein
MQNSNSLNSLWQEIILLDYRIALRCAVLVLTMSHSLALAEFTLPGTALFGRSNYDYAPSMYQEGNVQKFWWCGAGTVPNTNFNTDVIYYRSYNFGTRQWSAIIKVLWPTPGKWDGYFVCDPSVIRGQFVNPQNGRTYSHAMYYTATDLSAGTNNRIGVAFSNDGITWVKYSLPVISPQISPTSSYGAGQAATYSADGKSRLFLFHTDTSTTHGTRMWVRSTTNGRTFGPPVLLSNNGAPLNANSDFAFDWRSRYFYAAIGLPGRPGDRDTLGFVFARMPAADLLHGRGTWEQLGTVNTNLTGYYLNPSPGLLRDMYGNLTPWLPAVEAYFTKGGNDPGTWDLTWVIWDPTPVTLPFKRYYNPSTSYHKVTTGFIEPGFNFERTLGHLFMSPRAGTIPLYGCRAGSSDFFISIKANCGGHFVLGVNGWIYSSAQPDTQALYRCYTGFDHFVSTSPTCEGRTTESLLGYAKRTAQ